MHLELLFPVFGDTLPTDYGYALYSALSHQIRAFHDSSTSIAIGPISGQYIGAGQLQLDHRRSRLRLRLPTELIPVNLPLAGKPLQVAGHKIRLGVPQVQGIIPAASLLARVVVIKASSPKTGLNEGKNRTVALTKRYLEPAAFLAACRHQLDQLGVAGELGIPLVQDGPHAGKPRRRVVTIRDKKIVGFPVQITGLTADESIKVQENGIGGRRKMGCGFFFPAKKEDS
jgi:hypothetical protein